MSDDTGTPVVAIGLIVIVAATIAATLLLLPVDEEYVPADTTPPSVAHQPTNLPPALTAHATAASTALRGPQIQLSEPPAAPTTTTIPPAPCDELEWYRTAAGLPQRFDGIGYRESRCDNTAISRTGCCVGWLQLHWIIFRDHRMIDGLAACDATWLNVRGDTPEAKTRQMCAAAVLFSVDQYQPWATTS